MPLIRNQNIDMISILGKRGGRFRLLGGAAYVDY
jgi:hypothetical protein